jgi:hypothetical protein
MRITYVGFIPTEEEVKLVNELRTMEFDILTWTESAPNLPSQEYTTLMIVWR